MFRGYSLRSAFGLCAACLTASAAVAQDGGLRLVFGIEQTIEFGRNLGLTVPAEGSSTTAATTLSFGLISEAPLDRLEFTGSGAILVENTPDTDGTEIDVARPTLAFSYVREVPNALFGVDLRFVRDDVDRLAEDLADANAVGTQTEYGIGLRFETGRTAPASFFLAAAYGVVEYEDTIDPDLIDTRTTDLGAGTRLRFSEVLTGTFALGFTREDEDGVDDTTDTLTASVGLDYALPNGSASLDLTQSSEDGGEDRTTLEIGRVVELPGGTLAGRLGVSSSDLGDTDLVGGLDLTHELPDGAITFSLERAASFDTDADETTIDTALGLGWTLDVNAASSVAFDVSWAQSDSPSERIEETGFGATYRHALTADWQLNSGVRYRVRDDADGRAESPLLFVALGRTFDVRP